MIKYNVRPIVEKIHEIEGQQYKIQDTVQMIFYVNILLASIK